MPFTINDSYTFLLAHTLSGAVITDMPMSSVSFTRSLNTAGDFSATIPVIAETTRNGLENGTRPGIRSLYILRNGQPVYGGIIWGRSYNRADKSLSINGSSWESWFGRRVLKRTLIYAQVDQLDIFRDLVDNALHEGWNGFLPIDGANEERPDTAFVLEIEELLSGVLRDRTYHGYDLSTYGDRMKEISAVIEGFDWFIRTERSPYGPGYVRRLVFGYPYFGAGEMETSLVFEYPGNLADYSTSEDAGDAATSVVISGKGDDSAKLMAESSREWSEPYADAGWPMLEAIESADNVSRRETLIEHLSKAERQLAPPIIAVEATARGYTYPEVGTYQPGDYAIFRIFDDFTEQLITQRRRIWSYTVTVPDSGTEETVVFNLAEEENARQEDIMPDDSTPGSAHLDENGDIVIDDPEVDDDTPPDDDVPPDEEP